MVLTGTQIVPSSASRTYLGWFLTHFEMIPVVFILPASRMTRCSRLIFRTSYPGPHLHGALIPFTGNELGDHNLIIRRLTLF